MQQLQHIAGLYRHDEQADAGHCGEQVQRSQGSPWKAIANRRCGRDGSGTRLPQQHGHQRQAQHAHGVECERRAPVAFAQRTTHTHEQRRRQRGDHHLQGKQPLPALAVEVVTHQRGTARHDAGFRQADTGAAGDDQAKRIQPQRQHPAQAVQQHACQQQRAPPDTVRQDSRQRRQQGDHQCRQGQRHRHQHGNPRCLGKMCLHAWQYWRDQHRTQYRQAAAKQQQPGLGAANSAFNGHGSSPWAS